MGEGRAARPRVGTFFGLPGVEGEERACARRAGRRRGDRPPSPSARAPPPFPLPPPLSRARAGGVSRSSRVAAAVASAPPLLVLGFPGATAAAASAVCMRRRM